MVNLFPREVPRVLNLFPKELIEGPPKEFPKAKNLYSEQVNRMESHSANVCPRVLCGKTTGKLKVCVTQLYPKQAITY